ncbi:Ribonuclease P protein subunit p29 [Fukomys damarensis]|uniref:Ribonuclease P protein subunit p29 n=1 Tax=Fukomys damarensis TaxID=885580 RepID=A0A091DTN0_FUKDA|nr:Ribonuclease P protein subunit p29 [Fukomys damarensis]
MGRHQRPPTDSPTFYEDSTWTRGISILTNRTSNISITDSEDPLIALERGGKSSSSKGGDVSSPGRMEQPSVQDFKLQSSGPLYPEEFLTLSAEEFGVIYHAFSQKEAKEYDVQQLGAQRAEAFVNAFLKRSMPRMSQQACENQLQRKAVILEYFTRRKRKEKKKKSKGLSARERRDLQLFDIKPEQQRYNLFLPLHELWKQYIRDLCNGLKPDTQPQMIQAKLLKADLHGAVISVTKSKCPSYVGVTGILLQETKHVFKIITKEDRLKVIPKLNCVFAVEIDDFISYIYGSKFQLRSSERSAKKFKGKGTIDL